MKWLGPLFLEDFIWAQSRCPSSSSSFVYGTGPEHFQSQSVVYPSHSSTPLIYSTYLSVTKYPSHRRIDTKRIEIRIQNGGYSTSAPCTRRNLFEIALNQTEIRLHLPCTDWFGTANGHCPFTVPNHSVYGKYNLISVWFNKISNRFLCVYKRHFCVAFVYLFLLIYYLFLFIL